MDHRIGAFTETSLERPFTVVSVSQKREGLWT